jgi:hypothetical protein
MLHGNTRFRYSLWTIDYGLWTPPYLSSLIAFSPFVQRNN